MTDTAPARPATAPELTVTRIFDAPRDLVFKVWTDARHAKQWWGPVDYPATHLEMDVRPGGHWRGCLRSTADGRELWQNGVFREVVAPERLVFTFAWEEKGERGRETLVTVTFTEQSGKTIMTLHQAAFQSIGERDGHQAGWNSSFNRLVDYLTAHAS
jgi:uncharacterized protein YndB with AHSA1/START domain